jgi:DNA-binding winged helix-turn-helix (wHTH) protein/Flp pilus assembly protein TadD
LTVVHEFGTFALDVGRRALLSTTYGEVPLPAAAFDTLAYLVEHAGDIVDKSTLLHAVWPGVHIEENNLAQSISVLRRVLGERPGDDRFIATVPNRGYRFVATVAPRVPPSKRSADARAYRAYVTGLSALTRPGGNSLKCALRAFEEAIVRDPNFALAYVRLAHCFALLSVFGVEGPDEALPKARASVLRALELAPDLAEAHAQFAHIEGLFSLDWVASEREFQRALELDPHLALAHHYMGLVSLAQGEIADALSAVQRAQGLEPLALVFSANIGMIYYYARRYDEAVAQLQGTLAIDPGFDHARAYLGRTYLRLGETQKAIEQFKRCRNVTIGSVADLPAAYALHGRHHEARTALQQLLDLSRHRYVSLYDVAIVHAALDDVEGALTSLEHARELPFVVVDPAFDALRSEPRFQQIVARVVGGNSTT